MPIIEAAIALASEVFKMINDARSMKYIERMLELQALIRKQEAYGYNADDRKIEDAEKELVEIYGVAQAQMVALREKK